MYTLVFAMEPSLWYKSIFFPRSFPHTGLEDLEEVMGPFYYNKVVIKQNKNLFASRKFAIAFI